LSQSQKPHCRKHLQQQQQQKQQEQQIHIIMIKRVNTMLPQVEVKILKCSNFLAFSLSIKSCTSLIFTPAIFNSSTDGRILVKGVCSGTFCN
jgi:uncharacterized membrane protein YkgB